MQQKHVESTLNTYLATYPTHQSNWTPTLQSSEHKTIRPPERTSLTGNPQTPDTSLKSSPEPETSLIYIHHRPHEAPQHQASHYTSEHTRPATQALQSHTALAYTQNQLHLLQSQQISIDHRRTPHPKKNAVILITSKQIECLLSEFFIEITCISSNNINTSHAFDLWANMNYAYLVRQTSLRKTTRGLRCLRLTHEPTLTSTHIQKGA
ncbi:hypothetical protein HMPREF1549_00031 [Actinomyces johnsonii F0510]|uniref:Uncharacterized protein n=1 Tax=Actinomyces johnsonii F0510 TaxID=1227262 RepID=U1QNZ3_9ACTO|nr:hypothetical protein HMPREF1549_00031 [Actinomyces johnsonii F0510]